MYGRNAYRYVKKCIDIILDISHLNMMYAISRGH